MNKSTTTEDTTSTDGADTEALGEEQGEFVLYIGGVGITVNPAFCWSRYVTSISPPAVQQSIYYHNDDAYGKCLRGIL